MSEHDFEPIRGLPGVLPQGEHILWQGAPRWTALATSAFHVRAVAAYFAVMLAWRVGEAIHAGAAPLSAFRSAAMVAPIALVALGLLAFMGWLNSRTTVYTITNRRVVMRFGAALTKAINIPLTIIDAAAVKAGPGGAGDVALTLKSPNRIAFLQLWPHARPWKVAAPQPTFRAVADPAAAAAVLLSAMRGEAQVEIELAIPAKPSRQPAGRSLAPRPEASAA